MVYTALVRSFLPASSLLVEEEAWNAYPFTRTVYRSGLLAESRFSITVDTRFLADDGTIENALELAPAELAKRTVGARLVSAYCEQLCICNAALALSSHRIRKSYFNYCDLLVYCTMLAPSTDITREKWLT